MKKLLLLFFLSSKLFALEAEVTVLEAPLFAIPDEKSKVIQYYRKGDKVYIHPQEAVKDHFYKDQPQMNISDKTTAIYDRIYLDPLFTKPEDTYLAKEENPRFYRTIDKRGKLAYILKEQVHLYSNDEKELLQADLDPDPTDYRIEEPLPPHYPFIKDVGYKGYLGLGMGRPSDNFYPAGNLKDSTTNSSFQFWANWSKQVSFDEDRRLYWGWLGLYEAYDNTYLTGSEKAQEKTTRLAFGPSLNYDLWRRPKNTLNLAGTLLFNFYYHKDISKENPLTDDTTKDGFQSYFLSPTFTFSWQRLNVGPNMDFLIGSNIIIDLPHSMKGQSEDSYHQGLSLNFGLFIAAQTTI